MEDSIASDWRKVTKDNLRSVLRRCNSRTVEAEIGVQQSKVKNYTLSPSCQDWGEAIDVSNFCGRSQELAILEQWIVQEHCRLVALLGMGGIGKTALSVKLGEQLQKRFEFVIWRSLHNAPTIEALLFNFVQILSYRKETYLPESLGDKIFQLISYLQRHSCLIVLDNIEAIFLVANQGFLRVNIRVSMKDMVNCLSELGNYGIKVVSF